MFDQVITDWMGNQVSEAARGLLGQEESQDPQGPGRKVMKECYVTSCYYLFQIELDLVVLNTGAPGDHGVPGPKGEHKVMILT